uniref:Cytochrome c oxidase subunit 3 n=1 Tax=Bemisia afer TaxID=166114 RepID=A0A023IZA1_BEMAF|nr:cytochrome c oxidase subunit III [Bemisia afer]AHC02249.1 cytochrome oxidase subunit III [Bemisia afer]
MMMNNHYYHLVKYSPWPILAALNLASLGVSLVKWITMNSFFFFFFLLLTILIVAQWWRDVIRETLYEGCRSNKINLTINLGMAFFIVSELWFFISFFWAYFYFSLSPDMSMGLAWPPHGITPMNFMDIPLLNTLTLLTSGFFITWSHHSLINYSFSMARAALFSSIVTGGYFLSIQLYEYMNSTFSFCDSVFGNCFFILTGFHGIHVMIGLLFISVSYLRMVKKSFSPLFFHGFEYSIWYWHFVDLVWLFLYMFLYWWGM